MINKCKWRNGGLRCSFANEIFLELSVIRGTADQSFSSQPQDGKLNIPTLKTSCGSFSPVGVQTVFHVFFFSGERLIYFGLIWHVLMYHCSLECHWNPGLPSDFVLSSITIWGFCLPPSFLCPLGLCPNINYCCHIRRSCTKYVQNACGANYKDSYCIFFAVLILTIKESTYALPQTIGALAGCQLMMLSSRWYFSASIQPPDIENHYIPTSLHFSEGIVFQALCSLLVMYDIRRNVSQ